MQYVSSPPAVDVKALLRFLKIVYFSMFVAVGLYWVVLEEVAARIEPAELGVVKTSLAAVAAILGGVVLYLRFARIGALLTETTSDWSQRLARLRFFYILCFTLSEAVAIYGFVVRFLGGDRGDAIPFFLGAVVLFLLCYPRVPAALSEPGGVG